MMHTSESHGRVENRLAVQGAVVFLGFVILATASVALVASALAASLVLAATSPRTSLVSTEERGHLSPTSRRIPNPDPVISTGIGTSPMPQTPSLGSEAKATSASSLIVVHRQE